MTKKSHRKNSSEYISEFLNFMRTVQTEYEAEFAAVGECDNETSDLLHQIELGSYTDRKRFATQLAHCRQRRREHKDYTDVHYKLYEYFKRDKDAIAFYRRMEQLLGDVRKAEKNIESTRSYYPRVRKDLTIRTKES